MNACFKCYASFSNICWFCTLAGLVRVICGSLIGIFLKERIREKGCIPFVTYKSAGVTGPLNKRAILRAQLPWPTYPLRLSCLCIGE
jgi:hypothetical protein